MKDKQPYTLRRVDVLDLATKKNITMLREFAEESKMTACITWLLFVLCTGTAVGTQVWGLHPALTAATGCLAIVLLVMACANSARAKEDWVAYKTAFNRDNWRG